MKMLILKDSRVTVKAGETVEVSPAQADFLMSTGSAIPAPAKRKAGTINPEFEKAFETPEATADAIVETADAVPETAKAAEKETAAPKKAKTTRKK